MKQEFKPMSWLVKNFCCNNQKIEDYDVLKYRENEIKKMKKKCDTKKEFAEMLRREIQYHYWSKAEYELIIKLTDDGRIILRPWCGCRNPDEAEIDVTDCEDYDWGGFAWAYIDRSYSNNKKVDIYDQLWYIWESFVDYCWNYRHKWQRSKKNGN